MSWWVYRLTSPSPGHITEIGGVCWRIGSPITWASRAMACRPCPAVWMGKIISKWLVLMELFGGQVPTICVNYLILRNYLNLWNVSNGKLRHFFVKRMWHHVDLLMFRQDHTRAYLDLIPTHLCMIFFKHGSPLKVFLKQQRNILRAHFPISETSCWVVSGSVGDAWLDAFC